MTPMEWSGVGCLAAAAALLLLTAGPGADWFVWVLCRRARTRRALRRLVGLLTGGGQ